MRCETKKLWVPGLAAGSPGMTKGEGNAGDSVVVGVEECIPGQAREPD